MGKRRSEQPLSKNQVKMIQSVGGKVTYVDGAPIEVDLSSETISKKIMAAVGELPSLRRLNLGYTTGFRNEWIPLLANLTKLNRLNVNNTAFNDKGMNSLPDLPSLKTIQFLRTKVTDAAFEELARFPKLSSVSSGASMKITNKALKHLGKCTSLSALSLQFENGSAITDAGLVSLSKLSNLASLSFYGAAIQGKGLASLRELKHLKELVLDDTEIDDVGASNLSALVELQKLYLSSTMIEGVGLKHLAGMHKLKVLHLYSTDVSDKAVQYLTVLRTLKELNVRQTQITGAGIARLKEALPKTKIAYDKT